MLSISDITLSAVCNLRNSKNCKKFCFILFSKFKKTCNSNDETTDNTTNDASSNQMTTISLNKIEFSMKFQFLSSSLEGEGYVNRECQPC